MLRLRDEAHRYAITNHRIKRNKNIFRSEIVLKILDLKEKNLILYFGSLQEVKKADLKQLQEVPGINKNMAKAIYNYFRVN